MKALKLIREDGYENVHYASLGEQKFKTLVVADRKDEQEQWFEQPEIECVPEEVSSETTHSHILISEILKMSIC